jgi:hypothetical protein
VALNTIKPSKYNPNCLFPEYYRYLQSHLIRKLVDHAQSHPGPEIVSNSPVMTEKQGCQLAEAVGLISVVAGLIVAMTLPTLVVLLAKNFLEQSVKHMIFYYYGYNQFLESGYLFLRHFK